MSPAGDIWVYGLILSLVRRFALACLFMVTRILLARA